MAAVSLPNPIVDKKSLDYKGSLRKKKKNALKENENS